MANEQAAYALVAYERFLYDENTLYDMSDAADWDLASLPEQLDRAIAQAGLFYADAWRSIRLDAA
jgi:hypothetical protein